jgi:hypothetical protein
MRRVLLLFAALALGSCFSKPSNRCAFLCGTGNACPEDYECGSDDRCHLVLDNGDLAECEEELDQADASIDVISPTPDAGTPDAGAELDAI